MSWLAYGFMWLLVAAALVVAGWFVHDRAVRKTREECSRAVVRSAMEQATSETVDLGELVPRLREGER